MVYQFKLEEVCVGCLFVSLLDVFDRHSRYPVFVWVYELVYDGSGVYFLK